MIEDHGLGVPELAAAAPLKPVRGPAAWRGSEIRNDPNWIYQISDAELAELEAAGARFLDDDPDLRTVAAEDYPLPACAEGLSRWAAEMDRGRGFVLVRGLRAAHYSDALSAAIFFVMGLQLGDPMRQNERGDALVHVLALSDQPITDPSAVSTRIRDRLNYHSDSSDVVALMCLRGAKEGGASSLISGVAIYNEVLKRRPDLAPLLFQPWCHDWYRQDHDAPQRYYVSPICSYVEGVFSTYVGTRVIRTAQDYPETPRMSADQYALLDLIDEICAEPGVALDMDFRPGDVQWLLNYAALHSRTRFTDHPEPQRRRHLLRLWLKREVDRPLAPNFGRHTVKRRGEFRQAEIPSNVAKFRITEAAIPRTDW